MPKIAFFPVATRIFVLASLITLAASPRQARADDCAPGEIYFNDWKGHLGSRVMLEEGNDGVFSPYIVVSQPKPGPGGPGYVEQDVGSFLLPEVRSQINDGGLFFLSHDHWVLVARQVHIYLLGPAQWEGLAPAITLNARFVHITDACLSVNLNLP